jgi:two-component system sensor histidine kinase GlrK
MVELGREMEWLRQRLQALEEQKSRFLRHVSHELKTPLASLREGVGLLGDALAGPLNPRQQVIVEIMDGSSRELQKRIEDLIHYGGLTGNASPVNPVAIALVPLLDAVIDRQRLSLEARGIIIERHLQAAAVVVDTARLETALDNLLSNAIKFCPDGGSILIAASTQNDRMMIEVCNHGERIPAAERERIFEPFFQGLHQPASAVKGSGLGLAIARESLRGMNGDVMLVEREPWPTCFRLSCPCSLR